MGLGEPIPARPHKSTGSMRSGTLICRKKGLWFLYDLSQFLNIGKKFFKKYNCVSQHWEPGVKHTCDPNVFHLWNANGKQQRQNEQTKQSPTNSKLKFYFIFLKILLKKITEKIFFKKWIFKKTSYRFRIKKGQRHEWSTVSLAKKANQLLTERSIYIL